MDVKLDADDDLDVSTGDLVKLTGAEAIRQQLKIRLRLFLGEWFLDTRVGMPYYETVLVKNPNTQAVRALFQEAILGTPGVTETSDVALEYDGATRALAVTFRAVTVDDEQLDFSETFIIGAGA